MSRYSKISEELNTLFDKQIFFIVGTIKSGTTWLQKMLDGHPNIACRGESHLAVTIPPKVQNILNEQNTLIAEKNNMLQHKTEDQYPEFDHEDLQYLIQTTMGLSLLKLVDDKKSITHIGEKTPSHLYHLSVLKHIFPNAKVIQITRDCRDCIISGWHHIYRETPDVAKSTYPELSSYTEVLTKQWIFDLQTGLQFQNEHPNDFHLIKYEDLHTQPETSIENVIQFLNASSNPDEIKQTIDAGSFENLTEGRKRGCEDKKSHFRKGIIGDWKNHFDDKSLSIYENLAGQIGKSLGY
jgi:hypothetical protein